MKSILKYLVAGMLLTFCSTILEAQSKEPVEINFKVEGVCNMCKKRIENAALMKGVKFVEWTKETQNLKVIYKPLKVSELEIHAAVANIGHDTPKIAAPNEVYKELPGCCAYRDGIEVH